MKHEISRRSAMVAIAGALAAVSHSARAADYPAQTIRIIVPQVAGGLVDPVARLLASAMSTRLGQPMVVENRTGAGGAIGSAAVAKSPADGYTLLFHSSGLVTNAATQRENPGFDVLKDLLPVSRVAFAPFLVAINPALPYKSMTELIQYARANPGKVNFGSSGPGSSNHLAIEVFKRAAGIEMTHVPYRGGAQQSAALLGAEIDLIFDTVGSSGALARSGKIRGIATTGSRRSAAFPELPTLAESGVPGYEANFWLGFFAPAGTPPQVVEKLNAAVRDAVAQPSIRSRLVELGLEVAADSPAEFASVVRTDLEKWTKVASQLGKLD